MIKRVSLVLAAAGLACAAPVTGAAQTLPASAFADQIDDLGDYVQSRLQAHGRGDENQELLATFRMQMDRGLITEAQYLEAVRALGGTGPLMRAGRPFSGEVRSEPSGRDRAARIEATFAEGRVRRVSYLDGGGSKVREIVIQDGDIRETRYWGGPYGDAPRSVSVYHGAYMGDATTRVLTPSGELIREQGADGGSRPGPGWMEGLNMWDADNAFYRSVEACEPVKLAVNASYYQVLGPRGGGCAVEYGHWATPEPSRSSMSGKSMVCVHAAGSAYDFINTLHALELPSESCEGTLAELLREWKGTAQ